MSPSRSADPPSTTSQSARLTRVLAGKRNRALHISYRHETRHGRLCSRKETINTRMLDIRASIIELNPRVSLTLLRVYERETRHRLTCLLENRTRAARDRHRLGKHTNLTSIILKHLSLCERRNEIGKLIIDRIRKTRCLSDT